MRQNPPYTEDIYTLTFYSDSHTAIWYKLYNRSFLLFSSVHYTVQSRLRLAIIHFFLLFAYTTLYLATARPRRYWTGSGGMSGKRITLTRAEADSILANFKGPALDLWFPAVSMHLVQNYWYRKRFAFRIVLVLRVSFARWWPHRSDSPASAQFSTLPLMRHFQGFQKFICQCEHKLRLGNRSSPLCQH